MKSIKTLTFLLILVLSFCTINSFAQNQKALKFQNKATAFYEQDNFEAAIEYYDKALKKGKPNFDILFFKGMSYYFLKQYKNAIPNFNLALEINSKQGAPYFYKGLSYSSLGKHVESIEEYQKALNYAPREDYGDIYCSLGNSLSDIGEYPKAIQKFQMAIEEEEDNFSYYYNLAWTYSMMGNYEKAIEIDKITIRLNPQVGKAYNNIGMNYLILKNYREAIKMLKKAIELKTIQPSINKAYTYNNLAFCYLNINMLDKAIEYAEKSKALDSNNSYVYFTLAGIAAFKKDHEGFYNHLVKANELGFPLETRLDERFLKPYLEEERFKLFLK